MTELSRAIARLYSAAKSLEIEPSARILYYHRLVRIVGDSNHAAKRCVRAHTRSLAKHDARVGLVRFVPQLVATPCAW